MTTTATRGPRGEGSVSRKHTAKAGCPPVVNGIRPEHRCNALWRARVPVVVRGRKVTKEVYGKNQLEAVKAKKALLVKESQGRIPSGEKLTVAAWMELWMAETKLKPSTRQSHRSRIDTWVTPYLGTIRLDRLEGEDIERLYSVMRAKHRTEGTVHQVHQMLRRSLLIACRRKGVNLFSNPMDCVEPPSMKPTKQRRPLTVDETWRVLETEAAQGGVRFTLALVTGLRQGEACALRWSDLKLKGTSALSVPHLMVERGCYYESGVGWHFHSTKTDNSERLVPLPGLLVKKLSQARAKAMLAGAGPNSLVFPGQVAGCPISKSGDLGRWRKLLTEAGVPDPDKSCVHAARNTFAGLLETAGANDRVVATILGHASDSITHHYQELNLAPLIEAMGEGGLLETYLEKHHHQGGAAA